SKSAESQQYEKSLAFVALLLMVFDSERSDCVYKVLCKLRALTNICGERVQYQ
nr:6K1 protein [Daphne mosaic virus]